MDHYTIQWLIATCTLVYDLFYFQYKKIVNLRYFVRIFEFSSIPVRVKDEKDEKVLEEIQKEKTLR